MTNKPKRRTPLIRRLISIVAVFAVFFMSMPMAYAVDLEGSYDISFLYGSSQINTITGSQSANLSGSSNSISIASPLNGNYYAVNQIAYNNTTGLVGNIGFYLSYYFKCTNTNIVSTGITQNFKAQYTNSIGQTGVSTDISNTQFTVSDNSACSVGQRVKANYVGFEDEPITNIRITNNGNTISNAITKANANGGGSWLYCMVTSARVVSTETNEELEAMEALADAIAQQTQIMNAFYGEIIALCNSIYQRLGNLETALNLTNQYLQSIISVLNSIDSTTKDIYTLLGTQFALLISTISAESTNIQGAIADAEAKLEAYFDGAVADSGIADSGTASEDASTSIGEVNDGSAGYESSASESFATISADFSGFSGGTLSGVALATDLFSQVFNALGEYKVVYVFPLLLGVCLVIIGRISRHSGGASSRSEEKEE